MEARAACLSAAPQPVRDGAPIREPVDREGLPERPGAALQRLVDSAGSDELRVPPGIYLMADSLRLRSGLKLRGRGDVVLRQMPVVSSPLRDIVGYGHSEFRVADPDLFSPGMGVSFLGDSSVGFGVTVARITEQVGDAFYIDVPFERDYRPSSGARASRLFPLVAGYGIHDAVVSGLVIEGIGGDRTLMDGCRAAGIYLIGCANVKIFECEVTGYPGDALSFQQCTDTRVVDNHLHHNAGHGLHPGSGSVRYDLCRNQVLSNGGCGIYYCLRTTHSTCRDNVIVSNGADGVSIGERDTDHLITGNRIESNACAGIGFRSPVVEGGDRVVIQGNTFVSDGSHGSHPELDIADRLHDVQVIGNRFISPREVVVRVGQGCSGILLRDNLDDQAPLADSKVMSSSATSRTGSLLRSVGPAGLDLEGAKHLRVNRLPAWVD